MAYTITIGDIDRTCSGIVSGKINPNLFSGSLQPSFHDPATYPTRV